MCIYWRAFHLHHSFIGGVLHPFERVLCTKAVSHEVWHAKEYGSAGKYLKIHNCFALWKNAVKAKL